MVYDKVLYHGTTVENREKIVKKKYFKISRTYHPKKNKAIKYDHWLGDGIYFFEDEIHAYDWILKKFNDNEGPIKKYRKDAYELSKLLFQKYTILKSRIVADENRIWNLDNPEDLITFKQICGDTYEKLKDDEEYKNRVISEGTFINMMFKKMEFKEKFDMVVHTFQFKNGPKLPYREFIGTIPQKQVHPFVPH
jgi:hypothetical protein